VRVCCVCRSSAVERIADFGLQPISNRYHERPDEPEDRVPLRVGECAACGLVQLEENPPASELRSRFAWLTYREPEAHLDALAHSIASLPGLAKGGTCAGLSWKDESLLARLEKRLGGPVWTLDPRDLGLEPNAGVETIQSRLDPVRLNEVARLRGKADVVVARAILEHAADPRAFLEGVLDLVRDGGFAVLEVPDCTRSLRSGDVTMVWEEHAAYFTPETFQRALALTGLKVIRFDNVPYPYENSLIAVVQRGAKVAMGVAERSPSGGRAWAAASRAQGAAFRRGLRAVRERGTPVALFGAGHLAVSFLNLHGLAGEFDFVVDDHPRKQGLLMPGSKLPILPTSALVEKQVGLCLLAVNPELEPRIVERLGDFRARGGRVASVFPESSYAWDAGREAS
jgi:hypothetical protein